MTLTAAGRERVEAGKEARRRIPRRSHGVWEPAADRRDPVQIILDQDEDRVEMLTPVRHYRMAESAFTFYRGAAAIMAADLAGTPVTGTTAQICGDAHLSNFGTFASPERTQVFDVNDFDETLPGPWEWDVKRLAASAAIAAHDNGLSDKRARVVARSATKGYREGIRRMADSDVLAAWYSQLSMREIRDLMPKKAKKRTEKQLAKARAKNSDKALGKLGEVVDGQLRIRSNPPLVLPIRDLKKMHSTTEEMDDHTVREAFADYLTSASDGVSKLLTRFDVIDIAHKVVGVGSVGTQCFIVLLLSKDHGAPLFLQVKQAGRSVLEGFLPASEYGNHGQRVVEGQRLMQAHSDPFLGWSDTADGRHFYWRTFHDMKGSVEVSEMDQQRLENYVYLCGGALAHAHAPYTDHVAIASYLGSGDAFDNALAEFSLAYADQNKQDYRAFEQAIADGRVAVQEG